MEGHDGEDIDDEDDDAGDGDGSGQVSHGVLGKGKFSTGQFLLPTFISSMIKLR